MDATNDNSLPKNKARDIIALTVIGFSIIGVVILSWVIISKGSVPDAKYIFATVLPLIGTWVGTVLAFYFSRENFESANRNIREMVKQMTPFEKLKSIPIKSTMIPLRKIALLKITNDKLIDQIKLQKDILTLLDKENRNRLPVLGGNNHPKYMIHRSMIDKYITKKAIDDKLSSDKLSALTLKDLLNEDEKLKEIFENGFTTIKESLNLADAKHEMDKVANCSDVFVTANGTKNEPIIGWITNLIITENAKV